MVQKAVQSSFSLLQVQESLENRLEFESINNRYSIWKASTLQYTQPFVIQTFFNDIDSIIKKYLTQPIFNAHYKQMCQSVCYRAHLVPFSGILESDDDSFEPFFEKEVDDSIESLTEADEDRELDLKSLISLVDSNDIQEIWKISRYNYPKCYQHVILLSTGEHFCTCFMLVTHGIVCRHFFKVFVESSKACFNLALIPVRWYKDKYMYSDDVCYNEVKSNCDLSQEDAQVAPIFIRKYIMNDLSEKHSKQISRNQLKYGVLMGEAKKAIQFAIQDNDDELIQLIKEFNRKKEAQQIDAEKIRQQEALANRNDNRVLRNVKGVLIDSNQVLDPLKHQPKGRPPMKRLKSSIEKEKLKSKNGENQADKGCKCSLCGENGHYRSTCPKN